MFSDFKKDFCLAGPGYLLNHSVGRPLKSTEQVFKEAFLLLGRTLGANLGANGWR
ncbi:cysteine desulfurase [Shewanella sp. HN-41]|nr:cysteine desulfurase [Shewanella sp. HN-41]